MAAEVAAALEAPLDVIVVRKLGVPFQPELAMGAIGENGVRILNERVLRLAGITDAELADVERREGAELARRARPFRRRPRLPLTGRTVVIVDDGIATGSTARAACRVARAQGAGRVVVAAPVRQVEWRPLTPSPSFTATPTTSCASRPPGTSTRSASSTPTSPRRPTTK